MSDNVYGNAGYGNNGVLSWDSEIDLSAADNAPQPLLPAGVYPFTVHSYEKAQYTPSASAKTPASPMANVTLAVAGAGGVVYIKDSLILHGNFMWKLASFFRSLGMREHGDKIKMNFDGARERSGRVELIVDTWIGRDGVEHQSNKVKRYLDPDNGASAASPAAPAAPAPAAAPAAPAPASAPAAAPATAADDDLLS